MTPSHMTALGVLVATVISCLAPASAGGGHDQLGVSVRWSKTTNSELNASPIFMGGSTRVFFLDSVYPRGTIYCFDLVGFSCATPTMDITALCNDNCKLIASPPDPQDGITPMLFVQTFPENDLWTILWPKSGAPSNATKLEHVGILDKVTGCMFPSADPDKQARATWNSLLLVCATTSISDRVGLISVERDAFGRLKIESLPNSPGKAYGLDQAVKPGMSWACPRDGASQNDDFARESWSAGAFGGGYFIGRDGPLRPKVWPAANFSTVPNCVSDTVMVLSYDAARGGFQLARSTLGSIHTAAWSTPVLRGCAQDATPRVRYGYAIHAVAHGGAGCTNCQGPCLQGIDGKNHSVAWTLNVTSVLKDVASVDDMYQCPSCSQTFVAASTRSGRVAVFSVSKSGLASGIVWSSPTSKTCKGASFTAPADASEDNVVVSAACNRNENVAASLLVKTYPPSPPTPRHDPDSGDDGTVTAIVLGSFGAFCLFGVCLFVATTRRSRGSRPAGYVMF